jgi:OmpA-OmpF porin, OOP family
MGDIRSARRASVIVALLVATAGCGVGGGSEPAASTAAPGADRQPPVSGQPTVRGYPAGEFPPVPLFELPDLAMLDTALGGFSITIAKAVGSYPGLTVRPARCDQAGNLTSGDSALRLYGDGSGNYVGPDGKITNYGDGSGNYILNGTAVTVYGDGSGNYANGAVVINSYGDGSGNYTDGTVSINLYGDGSGNYADGTVSIHDYGDGSGSYANGGVSIHNYGDGSGSYADGTISISNYGDGTGKINGESIRVEPIPPVPPLGQFPNMGVLKPITSCGTTITLSDSVLFDFDQSVVRPDAAAVLDSLGAALRDLDVRSAEIGGHTDALGSDDYNRDLSTRRAQAVVDALGQRQVRTALAAQGFGESRPVAPNTAEGKDNPAGRELNRRVEIFIPTVPGAPAGG